MKPILKEIIELEDKELFQNALDKYQQLYAASSNDFEVWKHYYFFLWYISVEEIPLEIEAFIITNKINEELDKIGKEDMQTFSNNPDALFILGYTMNLFPYFFGDYELWEKKAQVMIIRAAELSPENIIYKMVKLGEIEFARQNKAYIAICELAAPIVNDTFSKGGFLNSYFKEVLNRVN